MILTLNIPRHRGRRAALYIGIAVIIVAVVIVSIALATRAPHPYGNVPINITASPTSTLAAAEQPYIMAVNELDVKPPFEKNA